MEKMPLPIKDNTSNATAEKPAPPPSIETVCLDWPLYSSVSTRDRKFLDTIKRGRIQFDAHCIHCQKESTFRTKRPPVSGTPVDQNWMLKPSQFTVTLTCTRNAFHEYKFVFSYENGLLTKYGQLPSLEDIAGADIRKYEKLLPTGYFGELKRATGLASHGIGIGSFVYLRRIFERMIHQHHEILVERGNEVDGFATMRMDDRIAALKDVLPRALVENKATYGILSRGIHELDEATCKKYFPVVRQAIIAILEQDLQQQMQEEQSANLRNAIAYIAGEVKEQS